MEDKQAQARRRLAKKLSEMRKKLRKDEREILDRLVVGSPAEVSGHGVLAAEGALYELTAEGAYSAEGAI